MNRIVVRGWGAISPAGWGTAALREALERSAPLPVKSVARPGHADPLRVRDVPDPATPPAFLGHARLRRSSRIARFTVAAALEALGDDAPRVAEGSLRLGIVVCVMTGGMSYSRRFFEEVLANPSTASPMLFPETVFNASASHLAACLGASTESCTLVGDGGMFLQGLALGANWLLAGDVEGCIVVGSEEADWIAADVLALFHRRAVHSEGAGALYLRRADDSAGGVALSMITDAFPFSGNGARAASARRMREALRSGPEHELLCLGTQGVHSLDAAEQSAWSDWTGPRISPKEVLGEAFTASAALQCVAACDALSLGNYPTATVSVVGANQQAIGARFDASNSRPHKNDERNGKSQIGH